MNSQSKYLPERVGEPTKWENSSRPCAPVSRMPCRGPRAGGRPAAAAQGCACYGLVLCSFVWMPRCPSVWLQLITLLFLRACCQRRRFQYLPRRQPWRDVVKTAMSILSGGTGLDRAGGRVVICGTTSTTSSTTGSPTFIPGTMIWRPAVSSGSRLSSAGKPRYNGQHMFVVILYAVNAFELVFIKDSLHISPCGSTPHQRIPAMSRAEYHPLLGRKSFLSLWFSSRWPFAILPAGHVVIGFLIYPLHRLVFPLKIGFLHGASVGERRVSAA